jgi:DNA helicase HerA-like ATPase
MSTMDIHSVDHMHDLFPKRQMPNSKQINFVVGTKMDGEQKLYLVELDPTFEGRVGDLLEAQDARTNRRYLMMVSDIEYAYPHKEEHAEMLDLLRRRPDREMDQPTFNALCKNQAVCVLLGEIEQHTTLENGYRPNKYTTTVIKANEDVERLMVNEWQTGVPLGCLRVGRTKREKLPVHFSTVQLVGQRFLIVGQTGKGKSTAVRHLLDGHMRAMHANRDKRRVGFLVDDFKMEYAFDIQNQRGEKVPGLVTTLGPIARDRLVILTCYPEEYGAYRGKLRDILKLEIPLSSLSLSAFCDLSNLTEPQKNVVRLVEDSNKASSEQFFNDVLAVDEYGMPDTVIWGKRYGKIFYSKEGRKKVVKKEEIDSEDDIDSGLRDRLEYIRRAVQRLLRMPFMVHNSNQSCLEKLRGYLREGCTVIVDKDSLDDRQREMLTVILLHHLFRYNQESASGKKAQRNEMIPVVVAVEEAQYLLSQDKVADPDSIFAKIAFTGRSYQIGLLAITQRPQAIQKELLGQFDGFLVLPLEHANDFRHLADACPALSGYRNDLASAPIGGGVLAYGTPKQVVALQIKDYRHEISER